MKAGPAKEAIATYAVTVEGDLNRKVILLSVGSAAVWSLRGLSRTALAHAGRAAIAAFTASTIWFALIP